MADEMENLEQELERLNRSFSYPETPSLAAAVRRRLEVQERTAAHQPGLWALPIGRQALAGIAAATVVALALALGVWSPGREAVADFFDRLNIFQTEESPAGLPREVVGTPVSPAEAKERLGFAPKEATCPKGVRLERALLQEFEGFIAVVLFYEHEVEPSFALFETSGAVAKGVPVDLEGEAIAGAEPVSGLGSEAYWLVGLRIVEYYDEQGERILESRRATDTNTLVWERGGLIFRVEGDLTLDLALCVAQSLR